jgi:ACT domain-containing protein
MKTVTIVTSIYTYTTTCFSYDWQVNNEDIKISFSISRRQSIAMRVIQLVTTESVGTLQIDTSAVLCDVVQNS